MNPKYLCTILVVSLALAARPACLYAADAPVQCTDSALADAKTILRQIELKVAMAQYEKILTAIYDLQLTYSLPDANATTAEEQSKIQDRAELRMRIFEDQRAKLRELILDSVRATNEAAAKSQQEKAK